MHLAAVVVILLHGARASTSISPWPVDVSGGLAKRSEGPPNGDDWHADQRRRYLDNLRAFRRRQNLELFERLQSQYSLERTIVQWQHAARSGRSALQHAAHPRTGATSRLRGSVLEPRTHPEESQGAGGRVHGAQIAREAGARQENGGQVHSSPRIHESSRPSHRAHPLWAPESPGHSEEGRPLSPSRSASPDSARTSPPQLFRDSSFRPSNAIPGVSPVALPPRSPRWSSSSGSTIDRGLSLAYRPLPATTEFIGHPAFRPQRLSRAEQPPWEERVAPGAPHRSASVNQALARGDLGALRQHGDFGDVLTTRGSSPHIAAGWQPQPRGTGSSGGGDGSGSEGRSWMYTGSGDGGGTSRERGTGTRHENGPRSEGGS